MIASTPAALFGEERRAVVMCTECLKKSILLAFRILSALALALSAFACIILSLFSCSKFKESTTSYYWRQHSFGRWHHGWYQSSKRRRHRCRVIGSPQYLSPQTLYQSPRVWGFFLLPDKHGICPLRHLYWCFETVWAEKAFADDKEIGYLCHTFNKW